MLLRLIKSFVPAIVWAVLITGMDLIPANPIKSHEQKWIIGPDKFIHFTQHFIFSALLFWGFLYKNIENKRRIYLSVLLPALLGIVIEIVQELWVPNRHFNIKDIYANVIGSLFLLLFTKTITNFQKNFFNPH